MVTTIFLSKVVHMSTADRAQLVTAAAAALRPPAPPSPPPAPAPQQQVPTVRPPPPPMMIAAGGVALAAPVPADGLPPVVVRFLLVCGVITVIGLLVLIYLQL